jgi:diguanylate cyclase
VASLLAGAPVLAAEAESLGAATKLAHSEEALAEIAVRLKQLCYQIELRGGDSGEQQELLLRLFKLLLENVSELLDDDSWLRGQIEAVQNLIAGPLDVRALEEATRSLKEVIYKQGQLKHSLSDVKLTVKNMMMTFIDRLGQVAASTATSTRKSAAIRKRSARPTISPNSTASSTKCSRKPAGAERSAQGARQDDAGTQEVQDAERASTRWKPSCSI